MRIGDATDGSHINAIIDRTFTAPAELVFRQWLTVDGLRTWFAPSGFEVTLVETEAVKGGDWRVEMRSTDGEVHFEYGDYREIMPDRRLVFTLTQGHGTEIEPRTIVSVNFTEKDGRTEIAFLQEGFETTERRDGTIQGWNECFDKLDARLEAVSAWTVR